MIKVLINAYACSPNMGSEPGMAWNWCVNLANHSELHIITEGEFKDKIEEVLPTLPQGKNMHFYYNPVSAEIRKMCWNQGDWRFYKHYKKWQFEAYQMATKIIILQKIDILHQLNMIGFREPGYLWKIPKIPLVWGPVDAKQNFPITYLQGAPLKTKVITYLKNSITYVQLKFSKRIRLAVQNASIIVAASSNSRETFQKFFNVETPLINETGCYVQEHELLDKTKKKTFDLLWVGKLDFRKQLTIAIQTLAELNNSDIFLHIVGSGETQSYKNLAKKLGVENQCKWNGLISHKEVQEKMKNADLLFFTSVAEGTPHVVLEAIGNNLPVLCFNTCGQGDSVDEKVGVKIELTNTSQSINDFANEIKVLYADREKLAILANYCKNKQIVLSWEVKIKRMVELYKSLL